MKLLFVMYFKTTNILPPYTEKSLPRFIFTPWFFGVDNVQSRRPQRKRYNVNFIVGDDCGCIFYLKNHLRRSLALNL